MSAGDKSAVQPGSGPTDQPVQIKTKSSISLLSNNLTASGNFVAYAHRTQVHVASTSVFVVPSVDPNRQANFTRIQSTEKEAILQVLHAKLGHDDVLITIFEGGLLQVQDESGQKMLFSHKMQTNEKIKQTVIAQSSAIGQVLGDVAFTCVAVDTPSQTLYTGASTGQIHVLDTQSKSGAAQVAVLDGHRAGVTAVACKGGFLASGDSRGVVLLWSVANGAAPKRICDFQLQKLEGSSLSNGLTSSSSSSSSGSKASASSAESKSSASVAQSQFLDGSEIGAAVTGLDISGNVLVASFSTGHIRMYDLTKKKLIVELGAHARRINALKCHPTRPMVAAAAEDGFVTVWTVPTPQKPKVHLLLCRSPDCGLLTGATWILDTSPTSTGSATAGGSGVGTSATAGGGGKTSLLAVSSYDSTAITLLPVTEQQ